MPDATSIARGLSAAQKKALLWLHPEGDHARWAHGRLSASLYVLWERGLVDGIDQGKWWRITKLGLAVRAVLQAEAANGEG